MLYIQNSKEKQTKADHEDYAG